MKAKFLLSYSDFANAQRLHAKQNPTETVANITMVICALFGTTLLLLLVFVHGKANRHSTVLDWAGCIFLILLPFARIGLQSLTWKRAYNRFSTGQECTVEFDSKNLSFSSDYSTGETLWTAFKSYVEGEKCFLLYIAQGRFLIFPKRLLDADQISELRTLFSEKIGRVGMPDRVKT